MHLTHNADIRNFVYIWSIFEMRESCSLTTQVPTRRKMAGSGGGLYHRSLSGLGCVRQLPQALLLENFVDRRRRKNKAPDLKICHNPFYKLERTHELNITYKELAQDSIQFRESICKMSEDTLVVLDQVTEKPSVGNVIDSLQKCRKRKNLQNAKKLHAHFCKEPLDCTMGNYIVPMFMDCGGMSDAEQAFNSIFNRNQYSWCSLISGCAKNGQLTRAFSLHQKMQEDGLVPSNHAFTVLVFACARLKDIKQGQKIHKEIRENGFEADLFVGSALVDMYAKFGMLKEAQQVFDRLPLRNVVNWTALIAGYADHGPAQKALECFEQMQLDSVYPNAITYISSLKACSSIRAIDKGREIHAKIADKWLLDTFVCNSLIDMYAKCGSLSEAREVFDKMQVRNIVSWNVLIAGYAEHGYCSQALQCFEDMQLSGISPNIVSFILSLKACCGVGANKGREIHAEIAQNGFQDNVYVGNSLIDMYAKCGSLAEANMVFYSLSARDVISWTAIISGYIENGYAETGLKYFEQMQHEGIAPNAVTFICGLKACGKIGAINTGRDIHTRLAQNGFHKDILVGNTLVDMYAKCGALGEAWAVLDKLAVRNVVSWNAIIGGCFENGLPLEALKVFEKMQMEGASPNAVTFACILKACSYLGDINKGRTIHAEIAQKGSEKDILVGNSLIDMYSKCGSLEEATLVLDKVPIRDVVSWTAVIAGYTEFELGEAALKCFKEMQIEGLSPNAGTYVCALKACGDMGSMEKGREIHKDIAEKGFENDVFVATSLVDMYAKRGLLAEARQVFDRLKVRDVIAWNAMIKGYGMTSESNMAVECFENMKSQILKPDATTFLCLLTACSHGSLMVQGQNYFRMMEGKYGISPTTDHAACMVDLLARAGHLHEAEKLLQTGTFSPSKDGLGALLSACKVYGELEVGLRCFQKLVQMNPENAAAHVLIASIYASYSRWDDVNRIEELRKHSRLKKKPAKALIEVNKKVHEFIVGNNENEDIAAALEAMISRMKLGGYMPNLDLVLSSVGDGEKESALCGHAEKFAIAFGLLHMPQGQTLHVTKNLRMCNDCHNVCKVVSRVEQREIILRESNWVHHFRDGLCSCGDMW